MQAHDLHVDAVSVLDLLELGEGNLLSTLECVQLAELVVQEAVATDRDGPPLLLGEHLSRSAGVAPPVDDPLLVAEPLQGRRLGVPVVLERDEVELLLVAQNRLDHAFLEAPVGELGQDGPDLAHEGLQVIRLVNEEALAVIGHERELVEPHSPVSDRLGQDDAVLVGVDRGRRADVDLDLLCVAIRSLEVLAGVVLHEPNRLVAGRLREDREDLDRVVLEPEGELELLGRQLAEGAVLVDDELVLGAMHPDSDLNTGDAGLVGCGHGNYPPSVLLFLRKIEGKGTRQYSRF